jgi:hypothetical protein
LSILWGWRIDRINPDRYDILFKPKQEEKIKAHAVRSHCGARPTFSVVFACQTVRSAMKHKVAYRKASKPAPIIMRYSGKPMKELQNGKISSVRF